MKIGIMTAIAAEMLPFTAYLPNIETRIVDQIEYQITAQENKRLILGISGIGQVNAAAMTARMIQDFHPDLLIFMGIAGNLHLDTTLQIGDIVIGKEVFQAESVTYQQFADIWEMSDMEFYPDSGLLAAAINCAKNFPRKAISGTIVSSDYFPAPLGLDQQLAQRNALCIDMESSAFSQICNRFHKPCLVIRSLSNGVEFFDNEVVADLNEERITFAQRSAAEFVWKLLGSVV